MPSGMAAIIAKESIATPLKEFVGTGPYKFKERRPDQYVLLTRFDQYSARKEVPSGYGGKKTAIADELRFIPVPNANTRVEGSLAGQYHFADLLPTEALGRLEKSGGKTVPILTPSFGFPYFVFNTKEGVMAKGQAAQAGYKGEPIRILICRQYDFHYNMALIMAEQLKRAGFKAELN